MLSEYLGLTDPVPTVPLTDGGEPSSAEYPNPGDASQERAAALEPDSRLNLPFTIANLLSTAGAVILPFYFYSWSAFIAFLLTYTVCGLGLTAGYHRLFAHRSYTVQKWLEHTIAICGYLAIQRGPIFWVAMHRLHHKHVDIPGKDPHTPKEGLLHVHFGWIQVRRRDVWRPGVYHRWSADLLDDPLYRWMDNELHDYLANVILLVSSFVVGGLMGARLRGFDMHNAICFLVWVGLLNRVALLQAFGLINSVCHMFGSRPYSGRLIGDATNNYLVAMIIFGEGWHNNHHAFPWSARQGLRWHQPDVAWYLIWLLARLGLAKEIRVAQVPTMTKHVRASRSIVDDKRD